MSAAAARPPLRRDTRHGLLGGVLAGLGERYGVDPVLLRVGFVVLAVASGGIALLGYIVAWAAIPSEGTQGTGSRPGWTLPRARVRWRFAAGVGSLTLAVLLVFRELGVWWSDALVWPLVLASFGAALLWQHSRTSLPTTAESAVAEPRPGGERAAATRFGDLYRGVFGVLLVTGAALLFLSSNNILGGVRDAALTSVVVIVAIGLILAPFLWRLGTNLASERAERIRSQERAELAAHLHDSVLQTLTLVQKRADDPREVAALARRQERELRDWLAGNEATGNGGFGSSLRAAAEAIEDDHRVAIEVVIVGDCPHDEPAEAILGAAREAILNAAKHAPEPGPIRVYAEVEPGRIEVFVRDRGPGFDPATVSGDRRGVSESIVGRMERGGGEAEVRSIPGVGTEVALRINRAGNGEEGL